MREAGAVLTRAVVVRVKGLALVEVGSRETLGRRKGRKGAVVTGERVGGLVVELLLVLMVLVGVVLRREGGRDRLGMVETLGVEGGLVGREVAEGVGHDEGRWGLVSETFFVKFLAGCTTTTVEGIPPAHAKAKLCH